MEQVWNVGKHRIWWNDEKNLMYTQINGPFDLEEYREHVGIQRKIFSHPGLKRRSIYLINDSVKLSKEVRKAIQKDIANEAKTGDGVDMEKSAFVGASTALRIILKIWMKLSTVQNSAFFQTEDEAVAWLST